MTIARPDAWVMPNVSQNSILSWDSIAPNNLEVLASTCVYNNLCIIRQFCLSNYALVLCSLTQRKHLSSVMLIHGNFYKPSMYVLL